MITTLLAVGLFVFFLSVYGVVMVGSHLLQQVQEADEVGSLSPVPDIRDVPGG